MPSEVTGCCASRESSVAASARLAAPGLAIYVCAVAKDAVLTFADVAIPRNRTIDALYEEQEKFFAPSHDHAQ